MLGHGATAHSQVLDLHYAYQLVRFRSRTQSLRAAVTLTSRLRMSNSCQTVPRISARGLNRRSFKRSVGFPNARIQPYSSATLGLNSSAIISSRTATPYL